MPVVAALAPLAVGAAQSIIGGIKAAKARKAAQNLQTPTYAPSKAIADYYQTALDRYNAGPYNTLQYMQGKKAADVGLGAGIGALQNMGKGAAVGNVGAFAQQYTNNLQNAAAQAEQTQRQNLGQVGQAANMKLGDQRFAFQQNQMLPFQKQLQLDYAQLSGANQLIGAGLSNINTGAQTAGIMAMRKNNPYGGYGNYGV